LIGRNGVNLIIGWCGRFLFFVVPRQFSQDFGEWRENQILIPDWTYFYCPGATLLANAFSRGSIFFLRDTTLQTCRGHVTSKNTTFIFGYFLVWLKEIPRTLNVIKGG